MKSDWIRSLHHIGISVRSIDRSITFYRDVFGMELLRQGTFSGTLFERIMALDGACGRSAMLRCGQLQIELFEFAEPKPKPADGAYPVSDFRITHFCIEVDDIEKVYRQLTEAAVRFHCPPLDFSGKAKATYGRDPDGNVFELVEWTQGEEASTGATDLKASAV